MTRLFAIRRINKDTFSEKYLNSFFFRYWKFYLGKKGFQIFTFYQQKKTEKFHNAIDKPLFRC